MISAKERRRWSPKGGRVGGVDELGRQDDGEAASRPQELDGVGDEVGPGGGEAGELHARAGGSRQGLAPRSSGELLVTDVGRIADHHVDRLRGGEREEAADAGVGERDAELRVEPVSRDPGGFGVQVDGVEERGGPLGAGPQGLQSAGGGF